MVTLAGLIQQGIAMFVFKPHWNDRAVAVIFGEEAGYFCDSFGVYAESISTGHCKMLYWPFGEGATFEEALDQALSKLAWMTLEDAANWIRENQTELH